MGKAAGAKPIKSNQDLINFLGKVKINFIIIFSFYEESALSEVLCPEPLIN